MIYRFSTLSSTNDEARRPLYRHGDIVLADFQSAGRGQRGHTWSSRRAENLTFSVVLTPSFLAATEQFLLSEVVALALVDTLALYGIEAQIKWTNDIYVGEKKITGVLIEQNLSSGVISRSIVGIGINVNQREFDKSLPNPVSIAQILGHDIDREELLDKFHVALMARYSLLESGDKESIQRDYHERIYRLGVESPFRLPRGEEIRGTIRGVRPSGELLVEHADMEVKEYLFRQIEFVI